MSENILKISGLKVAYGGIKAVKGIDLEVNRGELVTLIGANGAGKTTTLKAITGTLPACKVEGSVSYLGQPLGSAKSFKLVQNKLAMVPEGRGVFTRMSIHENLLMGAYTRNDKAGIEADIDKWYAVFPRLKERANQLAGTLSGGEQQMLAMARAVMLNPEVVLLDEPSMGLAPILVDEVFRHFRAIRHRRDVGETDQFLDHELHVPQRGNVRRHQSSLFSRKESGMRKKPQAQIRDEAIDFAPVMPVTTAL